MKTRPDGPDIPNLTLLHVDEAKAKGMTTICGGCPHAGPDRSCELYRIGKVCPAGEAHVWYAEHIHIANKLVGDT